MLRRNVEPDVIVCNVAINACTRGDAWTASLAVLQSMERCAILPDEVTFNSLMGACGKGAEWSRALFLLTELHIQSLEFNTYTCSERYGGAPMRLWSQLSHAGLVTIRNNF